MNRSHLLALAALTLLAAATDPARASDAAAPERSEPVAAEEPSREPAAPATPARRWTSSAEIAGGSYRLSLSRGALDMGLGFDPPVRLGAPAGRSADPTVPLGQVVPSLSFGLRSVTSGPAPASLIERAGDARTVSSTRRVGLEWKPVQSRVFFRGGLGVRLSGDDRVTMRLRAGTFGLYMKSSF